MHAEIIGLGQQLSLVDGSSSHQITLVLPSGAAFTAVVDEEVAQLVTEEFVAAGGEAVARAVQAAKSEGPSRPQVHPALAQARSAEPSVQTRDYAPMELADGQAGADGDLEFGGDLEPGTLAVVGDQLRQAERSIAAAIGDTDPDNPQEMHAAANRLRGIGELPTPNWAVQAQSTKGPEAPAMPKAVTRRTLRIGQDAAGNPVLKGPGVVDHRALLGGTSVEEGDAGQF